MFILVLLLVGYWIQWNRSAELVLLRTGNVGTRHGTQAMLETVPLGYSFITGLMLLYKQFIPRILPLSYFFYNWFEHSLYASPHPMSFRSRMNSEDPIPKNSWWLWCGEEITNHFNNVCFWQAFCYTYIKYIILFRNFMSGFYFIIAVLSVHYCLFLRKTVYPHALYRLNK